MKMGGRTWTQEELETVSRLYPVTPWPALLKALPGRTKAAIRCQVISRDIRKQTNSRTSWTGTECAILTKMYPREPWSKICAAIPRHPQGSIGKQANAMKLKRDGAKAESRVLLIRELRKRRREMGIPVTHLANRIGVHRVQLSKWERGEQLPRLRGLFDWVGALGFRLEIAK
jgi:DNA-binding transcriptional regulator YiaG